MNYEQVSGYIIGGGVVVGRFKTKLNNLFKMHIRA